MSEYVLTLSCKDRPGIVKAVAGYLADRDCNILDSAQYGDADSGCFFMRVHFEAQAGLDKQALEAGFAPIADKLSMIWQLYDTSVRTKALVLVSKFDHCLHDLLYRWQIGELPVDIAAVASNHEGGRALAQSYDLPFHYHNVTPTTKADVEEALINLIEEEGIELIILARYMQILSAEFCARYPGRIINIHHSFLPSFKGARPYNQAYAHGVKLIGATAHFVTADLDEGPIIEQDVVRVDHGFNVEKMVAAGRDVERQVLARAVSLAGERRILLNGAKTVIFK